MLACLYFLILGSRLMVHSVFNGRNETLAWTCDQFLRSSKCVSSCAEINVVFAQIICLYLTFYHVNLAFLSMSFYSLLPLFWAHFPLTFDHI
uniref:Secreted protein n=1 Tax=Arundo donax TaxID=35708 RepID=A0A0A9FCV1_ARUDO